MYSNSKTCLLKLLSDCALPLVGTGNEIRAEKNT